MRITAKSTLSRRHVLRTAAHLALSSAWTWTLAGCGGGKSTRVCADPAELSDEQVNLRAATRYTERSPVKESCSSCAFFKAEEDARCGSCELLTGPVNSQGHCNSWSARADTLQK